MGLPIPSATSVKVENFHGTERTLWMQNTGVVDLRVSNDQDAMDSSVDPITGTVTDGMLLRPGEQTVILEDWIGELYARSSGIPGELEFRWSGMEPNKPGSRGVQLMNQLPQRPAKGHHPAMVKLIESLKR